MAEALGLVAARADRAPPCRGERRFNPAAPWRVFGGGDPNRTHAPRPSAGAPFNPE